MTHFWKTEPLGNKTESSYSDDECSKNNNKKKGTESFKVASWIVTKFCSKLNGGVGGEGCWKSLIPAYFCPQLY